ncbi:MAG: nuclear transport factor 2 family protein [Gammaproteobacteria bacterium]|nr:nuclear transport factor 2 family protein [Gammaproteobacteria bacterium]
MLQRLLTAATAFLLLTACGPVLVADDASKRELINRQHVEVWSRGNLAAIDEIFSEDFVGHFPGTLVEGRRALKAYVDDQRSAHPQWRETVQSVIVEGSRGASQVLLHDGAVAALLGDRSLDGALVLEQGSLFEFDRGRISRQWVYPDTTRGQQASGRPGLTP